MKKYVWFTYNKSKNNYLSELIANIKKAKIDGIMLNCDDSNIIKKFKENNIDVHLWNITLLKNEQEIVKKHPHWYMVNGEGKSSNTNPAYVDYYKWLCPRKTEVKKYLKEKIISLLKLDIDGFHLDYIRYPDVFLPKELQKHYGIVQKEIEAKYDYCYCSDCRDSFKEKYTRDIHALNAEDDRLRWLHHRLEAVNSLVNEIAEMCRKESKTISAAVFPSPQEAKRAVRQDWGNWNLDMFFPMLYHNFYGEDLNWIGKMVSDSVDNFQERKDIIAGIFMQAVKPDEISKIKEIVQKNGGCGLSFFEADSITDQQWQEISKI